MLWSRLFLFLFYRMNIFFNWNNFFWFLKIIFKFIIWRIRLMLCEFFEVWKFFLYFRDVVIIIFFLIIDIIKNRILFSFEIIPNTFDHFRFYFFDAAIAFNAVVIFEILDYFETIFIAFWNSYFAFWAVIEKLLMLTTMLIQSFFMLNFFKC